MSSLGPTYSFSDLAGRGVLDKTKRRCDRVLLYLRSSDEPVSAEALAAQERERTQDYGLDECQRDLRRLERAGLVRSVGHPKRWEAR